MVLKFFSLCFFLLEFFRGWNWGYLRLVDVLEISGLFFVGDILGKVRGRAIFK